MRIHDVLEISGAALTIDDLAAFVAEPRRRVALTADSRASIAASHSFLTSEATDQLIYGVNTGFGPMAYCILGRDQLVQLQYNLIRSHAAGAGTPIAPHYVLAAMVIRLNTLACGASGVSPALASTLETFINHRIVPVVPEHGGVGASGDLVQLAHIGLALIGEGEVFVAGERMPTAEALRRLDVKPHQLGPKEGLALINGTAMMTGIAALLCDEASRLVDLATRLGALALELVRAFDDSLAQPLHDLRPHPGQRHIAARLRALLASSTRLRDRRTALASEAVADEGRQIDGFVQEVYSLRCIPQILGPVHDAVTTARGHVEVELNAVTDNPVVLWQSGRFLHGGNFHGDAVASAVDHLKAAIVKLTMLAERRVNFFLNAQVNRALPPFLNLRTPGFDLALQGLQFVATSTTAHSQTLAYPQHLHSIPTNGDNQDVVSLGTDAALVAAQVVDNAFIVQSIEAVTLAQAVDCLGAQHSLTPSGAGLYRMVRDELPAVSQDRPLYAECAAVRHRLRADRSTADEGLALARP